jgi:3-oxoacyl-[acyl-carrier protein] reductase
MRRVALVTGGAKGIGRGIALDLAAKGWDVAICYRASAAAAEETLRELERRGARALGKRADVGVAEQAEDLFAHVRRDLGAPDALVHAAGPYHRIDVLAETPAGWREMLSGNLDSFFYCARLAAPAMRDKGYGRIIAFAMANADKASAQPGVAAHYVSKVGVLVLVRTLARALAPHHVTVNCISPGFIDSGSAPPEELAKMVKTIPAGALGSIEDCVRAVSWLMSDQSDYVTGANLVVSGGWGL